MQRPEQALLRFDMSDCCSPRGYRRIFSEKQAFAAARRYRAKGLDSTARRIVDFLLEGDVKDRTVLEIGGGVGAVQLELLRAGATHAVSVELTPTYEAAAAQLLREDGFNDRVERRVVDFVEAGADVNAADVVVLNRVVCCYPKMPALVGAAADHARAVLVMSIPKRTWWTQMGFAAVNLGLTVARREFHLFLHDPDEIRRTAEEHGLRPAELRRGIFWNVAVWERHQEG
jgi:hypothetical protein